MQRVPALPPSSSTTTYETQRQRTLADGQLGFGINQIRQLSAHPIGLDGNVHVVISQNCHIGHRKNQNREAQDNSVRNSECHEHVKHTEQITTSSTTTTTTTEGRHPQCTCWFERGRAKFGLKSFGLGHSGVINLFGFRLDALARLLGRRLDLLTRLLEGRLDFGVALVDGGLNFGVAPLDGGFDIHLG
jgi:hypothetical protein